MPKSAEGPVRRSDLFVVRIWGDAPTAAGDPTAEAAATPAYHGRVQRAISGEAQNFQGWPALIDVLVTMLAAAPAAQTTGTDRGGKERGNKARQ